MGPCQVSLHTTKTWEFLAQQVVLINNSTPSLGPVCIPALAVKHWNLSFSIWERSKASMPVWAVKWLRHMLRLFSRSSCLRERLRWKSNAHGHSAWPWPYMTTGSRAVLVFWDLFLRDWFLNRFPHNPFCRLEGLSGSAHCEFCSLFQQLQISFASTHSFRALFQLVLLGGWPREYCHIGPPPMGRELGCMVRAWSIWSLKPCATDLHNGFHKAFGSFGFRGCSMNFNYV